MVSRTSYKKLRQHLILVKNGVFFEKNAPQDLPLPIENQVFYNKIKLCVTLKNGAESENQGLFLFGLGPYALWSVYDSLNFQDILNF